MSKISKGYKEYRSEIEERVRENLRKDFYDKKMHNKDLATRISTDHDISFDSSYISKTISGKITLTLASALLLGSAMGMSSDELLRGTNLLSSKGRISFDEESTTKSFLPQLIEKGNLTTRSDHEMFSSIYGTYHCYFWPTRSSSDGSPQCGKLTFFEEDDICKASMLLATGDIDDSTGGEIFKEYHGILIAGASNFCILSGVKGVAIGELSFLAFSGFKTNNKTLACAIAEVLTVSAGNRKRYPTVHRMLLSRKPLLPEHYEIIMPMICLNSSRYTILESNLHMHDLFTSVERDAIKMLCDTGPEDIYCHFTEKEISGYAARLGMSDEDKGLFFSKLRRLSLQEKYNKTSTSAEDNVWHVLNSLNYYDKG